MVGHCEEKLEVVGAHIGSGDVDGGDCRVIPWWNHS